MRWFIILIGTFVPQVLSVYFFATELPTQWKQFKELHQKSYHWLEERKRIQIFKDNVNKIEKHNDLFSENAVSFKMRLNHFADLTAEEFIEVVRSYDRSMTFSSWFAKSGISLTSKAPDAIDWRDEGAVTDVKDQGACGSSWIFSVTGALESQNFLQTGRLIPLSEQELADCASSGGCTGGTPDEAYRYVMEHGLSGEADYPDINDGDCHRGSIPSAVTENGYVSVVANEEGLREIVGTVGPVAVAVDASSWQFYSEGVLDCQGSQSANHAVLVVGYGREEGGDYWLLKNSWSSAWGEMGYIKVARGGSGSCGVTSAPTYPIVQG